jgi:hypothetical protein
MKKSIVFLFISISFLSNAQIITIGREEKFKLSHAQVSFGGVGSSGDYYWLQDYKLLAPNSAILSKGFESFNQGGFSYSNHMNEGSNFSAQLILSKPLNRTKNTLQIRAGLLYGANRSNSKTYSKTDQFAYDTLRSTNTGKEFYIDSISTIYRSMNYSFESIGLDASFVFETDESRRLSVFFGAGLNFGLTFNAKTRINEGSYYYLSDSKNYYYDFAKQTTEREEEIFKNKSGQYLAAYIPLGVSFRLAKKAAGWNQIYLFSEMRPGINFQFSPELDTKVISSFTGLMGVRLKLNG